MIISKKTPQQKTYSLKNTAIYFSNHKKNAVNTKYNQYRKYFFTLKKGFMYLTKRLLLWRCIV